MWGFNNQQTNKRPRDTKVTDVSLYTWKICFGYQYPTLFAANLVFVKTIVLQNVTVLMIQICLTFSTSTTQTPWPTNIFSGNKYKHKTEYSVWLNEIHVEKSLLAKWHSLKMKFSIKSPIK